MCSHADPNPIRSNPIMSKAVQQQEPNQRNARRFAAFSSPCAQRLQTSIQFGTNLLEPTDRDSSVPALDRIFKLKDFPMCPAVCRRRQCTACLPPVCLRPWAAFSHGLGLPMVSEKEAFGCAPNTQTCCRSFLPSFLFFPYTQPCSFRLEQEQPAISSIYYLCCVGPNLVVLVCSFQT
jgi:hypothetical protein